MVKLTRVYLYALMLGAMLLVGCGGEDGGTSPGSIDNSGSSTVVTSIEWEEVSPTPTGNDFTDITWNGSQYLAVGDSGIILTSTDGVTWVSQTSGTTEALDDINWNGSQYLAVGEQGTILTSSDGVTWVSQISGTTQDLFGINWNGSQYVVVGLFESVLTSPDGVTWTKRASGTDTVVLTSVTWNGSQYVAVGGDAANNGVIFTSLDSVTWINQAFGLSTFVLNSVIWNDNQYVVVGDEGIILTSSDGVTWVSRTLGTLRPYLEDVVWNGNQYVVVGYGSFPSAAVATILTSPDGVTWMSQTLEATVSLNAVNWNGSQHVAVGDAGTILISPIPAAPVVTPSVSIAAALVAEGSSGGTTNLDFTITLSVASSRDIAVDYVTTDGTALSTSDYTSANATLTIPAGNTSGTITIIVAADTQFESTETLTVTLSNPVNSTLGTVSAIGTITNDDAGGLNDTGITQWSDTTDNTLTVSQAAFPGQDADFGRDADIATNSNSDGRAGFSFIKLDGSAQPLADQAVVYGTTPWDCVQDQVTGLMWEVKTVAGAGGLRDASHTYSWYNSSGINDGGAPGTSNGGICVDTINCDTEKYMVAFNAIGACGYSDWRLPEREELRSIVDYSDTASGLTIDADYFPNTVSGWYWSASPYVLSLSEALSISFFIAHDSSDDKSDNNAVRLVRGGM